MMIIDNHYVMTPETEEEIIKVNELLLKMREENQHKELIEKYKQKISSEVIASIENLGLAETKRIIRGLLKEMSE